VHYFFEYCLLIIICNITIYKIIFCEFSESLYIRYIVAYEELYERINDYHIQIGHGGNVKLRIAVANKYTIPRPAICNFKKNANRKLVNKPIISKDFNKRGQVDLVDFQSVPDGKFKWILNYQDHSTKFLSLRPLKSKRVSEVANNLLTIFLTFGAPKTLQSETVGNLLILLSLN
jgi:hypothetical protein